ncbi:DUF4157 domain-containing protein [Amycolatopsis sp. VS8301801F10]|uniref:aggregation-promoting factor C-terminal-like domain-containing protein n=1 Tax=Amycolatopsis sp. VS8301801F10 TaxID=2652442 RepID=UPI0038FC7437
MTRADENPAMMFARQSTTSPKAAPPVVHEVLRESGEPLDHATLTAVNAQFGEDFSQVRVHAGARAAESAAAVGARAYTVGAHVVFGCRPDTEQGQRVLAHELTHVVQQRGAGAIPSSGLPIGDAHAPAEAEARHRADGRTGGAAGAVDGPVLQRDDMDDPRLGRSGARALAQSTPRKTSAPAESGGRCPKPDDITEAEDWIIEAESGWRPTAKNPASTAFGLGQLLRAARVKYLKDKADSTDCDDQIRAFRAYVRDVYGTAEIARQFWEATKAGDATKAPKGFEGKAKQWIKHGWVGY